MENNVEIEYISKIETKDDNDNSDKSTKNKKMIFYIKILQVMMKV